MALCLDRAAHSPLLWVQHKHLTLKRRVQTVSKDIIAHPYRTPCIFLLFWGYLVIGGKRSKGQEGVRFDVRGTLDLK